MDSKQKNNIGETCREGGLISSSKTLGPSSQAPKELNYRNDLKIQAPPELKLFILAKMLNLYVDDENSEEVHKRDGYFKIGDVSVEFKYGNKTYDCLSLEVWHDTSTKFPGCISEAKADYIIFIKKERKNTNYCDILVMDYKKLVKWWWEEKNWKNFNLKLNKPTYDPKRNKRWISSHCFVKYHKIPPEIIISQKRQFNISFLLKKKGDLTEWK